MWLFRPCGVCYQRLGGILEHPDHLGKGGCDCGEGTPSCNGTEAGTLLRIKNDSVLASTLAWCECGIGNLGQYALRFHKYPTSFFWGVARLHSIPLQCKEGYMGCSVVVLCRHLL